MILIGCSTTQVSPIEKERTLIITVNMFDSSLTFIDEDTATVLTTWEFNFPVQSATLLDDDHLLLYGKTIPTIYVYKLSTGKKVAEWEVEHGIYHIEVDAKRQELYATSPYTNEVLNFSTDGKLLQTISVGAKPQSLIKNGDKLIVLNYGDDTVSSIDLATKQVVSEWSVSERAIDGAIVEANDELWIGGHGKGTKIEHNISIYDLSDGHLLKQIYAPVMPVIFESLHENMYVLSHGSNELRKIDLKTREVLHVTEVGANPFALATHDEKLYIAGYDSNNLSIVDSQSLQILSVLPVGEGPIQVLIRE